MKITINNIKRDLEELQSRISQDQQIIKHELQSIKTGCTGLESILEVQLLIIKYSLEEIKITIQRLINSVASIQACCIKPINRTIINFIDWLESGLTKQIIKQPRNIYQSIINYRSVQANLISSYNIQKDTIKKLQENQNKHFRALESKLKRETDPMIQYITRKSQAEPYYS